ncbi:UMP kinase [Candidatus Peregrinibacteria bacterium]|jgi:uridylate kinase|nr:UMP kinase [Candidatus Peregrinibacteria bacterium]MBT7484234.1 UMP kinase [Candidatus Peregrinibacteria bacterium]MBT7703243.1 UMP kinase [Candidatus Peregrinibacteria bacterium]
MAKKKTRRIMLKFSGEVLRGKGDDSVDFVKLEKLAKQVVAISKKMGVVMVIGGGNIWRYRDNKGKGIPRVESDFMGMMATVMNGVAVQAVLERLGVECRVMSALPVSEIAEPYVRRKALDHLKHGRIVICAGGTGRPFFTTDTAAALRGLELDCDVLLKATKVDGVYDKDPEKHKNAKKYKTITFDEVIKKKLAFMDITASTLCREGGLEVRVFDLMKKGNLAAAAAGKKVGTCVHN